MSLPANDAPWPPKPHDLVLAACAERQVWWEGDPEKLAGFYGGKMGDAAALGRVRRTYRAAKAAWWGKQPSGQAQPKKLHVPVAADVCRVAASTLFSSPVMFSDPGENKKLTDRIDTILNTPETYSRMLVAAESAAALSGVYGRVVWDDQVDEHTWIDWVDADRAIPEFRWGKLAAVTFWTELQSDDDRTVWRHLERYDKGVIEHGLYVGTKDQLGRRVDLASHTATQHLTDTVALGIHELAARYMPHHRPNPQWRSEPALKDLGRPDLSTDVIHLMDAIDETWSSWMNDLAIGRGRMFVSENMLNQLGPGRGTQFEMDRSVFSPVGNPVNNDGGMGSLLQAQQFEIRIEQHEATFDSLFRRIISRTGYSPLTFGLQDEVAVTATEVDAKERDTNATRSARIRLWSGLAELATIQLALDAVIFHTGAMPTETITVEWPAMHQQSERQLAETVQLWEGARAASTQTKVAMLHPEWDEQRVDDEVAAILGEQNAQLPISITGPDETTQPDDGPLADDPEPEPDKTDEQKK
ncbi:phage portal protein [Gordonia sihwensis]|uniref:phage portal protein n=1 Tax=Gordonia sihwensis TaxID=173559 RepID=UPI002417E87A|nr:phage portal protein [Gordonia sihwensis]WFN91488.1 phage portal protein [Gordonia sihwensis]WFN91546.1 phage portal protein [Gordonia sihwensis]